MEVLAELTGTEREEVLDGGDQFGQRLRPIGEVVGIKHQRLRAAVAEHVGLILERAHGMQRRRPRGVDLVGGHVEQDLGPVERQHRDLAALPEALGTQRLRVPADLIAHLARSHGAVADEHRR